MRAVPFLVVLGILAGCGGSSKTSTTAPPTGSVGTSPDAAFGMQCGLGTTADCEGSGGQAIAWPATKAQPGCIRLHDAGTEWSVLNPSSGTYSWTNLDSWLDVISQHEPRCAIETFVSTPCWANVSGQCNVLPVYPNGTNAPPSDLATNGSPNFNSFVTAFVQHCSPAGNCVKNIIKYYEMWNEWDLTDSWTGSETQMYQMVKPAVSIIRSNVSNAVILMPSTTPASSTYQTDFQNWLDLENANGRVSDWVNWHLYLSSTAVGTNTPEVQWATYAANYLKVQNSTSGWASTPWANTETNFTGNGYACPLSEYTPSDCIGQVVRWQLLHLSNGAATVVWFKWHQTIGDVPAYETAYYDMIQYLAGGKFSSPCSDTTDTGGNQIWSCNFTESSGTSALLVWTPTEGGTVAYSIPSGYSDYLDFSGDPATSVSGGQSFNLSPMPILLEK